MPETGPKSAPQTAPERRPIPTERTRTRPFDPPPDLGDLRTREPVCPVAMADGANGWLLTRHADVHAVLGDHQRFSSRGDLRSSALDSQVTAARAARPGEVNAVDPPEHTRLRRKLAGKFTTSRMARLSERITAIVDETLDRMERHGPPVDLVEAFASPVPSLVICELLGVDYAQRAEFQERTRQMLRLGAGAEQFVTAVEEMAGYVGRLVEAKRAAPTDDVLGALAADEELTTEEVSRMGLALLAAGHETTAHMLALGTFALLRHPDQLAALRADPGLVNGAVEELLRYLTIAQYGAERSATEDVEVGGRLIRRGEVVVPALMAANRDPQRFADPDALDVRRQAAGHVAFGFGIHQCLGQQLARIELRIGYRALLARFPTLRLAVPPQDVPLRTDSLTYGVAELPVEWDRTGH
ncbi:putative cytochrome P450 [Actinacidiphila reveromycinica]|uniref:Putative cytochrome P450 n=1 Tax=Actinacidiphila reveromycinica TaxID=659352 RepID=A0A7U3UYS7_9ACTN|nr:cytochrome P450 [Streptomyces sp. SN-593]BBB01322.1 putative cytochrome P450 [Streptomyces sp. SN-593]